MVAGVGEGGGVEGVVVASLGYGPSFMARVLVSGQGRGWGAGGGGGGGGAGGWQAWDMGPVSWPGFSFWPRWMGGDGWW